MYTHVYIHVYTCICASIHAVDALFHLKYTSIHPKPKHGYLALHVRICRFATDLSLWRPATSEQVERTNAAKSLFFSSVDIQPAATAEEKVQMFKSVLKGTWNNMYCTTFVHCIHLYLLQLKCIYVYLMFSIENEEEDDEDIAHEFLPSPPPSSSSTSFPLSSMGLSQLALSVSIDTAHVSMLLHVREDKEVIIERRTLQLEPCAMYNHSF